MPKNKLTEYSATNASNTDVGGVNIDEGMLPSAVNNSIRELMTHLKNFSDGTDAITGLTVDGNIKLDGNYPTGTGNVALGDAALDDGSLADNYNTAIGSSALSANTGGQGNTAVGYTALLVNTDGDENTALGQYALYDNTTGASNVAVGRSALENNTTGVESVAVGYQAGFANTTGRITAVGRHAVKSNTTATENTGIGYRALRDTTTGANNTAVGGDALLSNTTGSSNTAVGFEALKVQTTAQDNVGIGYRAGVATTTGSYNCYIGFGAGLAGTTAFGNSFMGTNYSGGAGSAVTTGDRLTIVGGFTGNSDGVDLRTQSRNIALSDGHGLATYVSDTSRIRLGNSGDGVPHDSVWNGQATNSGAVFFTSGSNNDNYYLAIQSKSNTNVYLSKKSGYTDSGYITFWVNGSGVGNITTNGSSVSYNSSSDHRLKDNVVDLTGATTRLKQLNPVRFNFIADAETTVDGFLAHEVQTVVPEAISGTHNEVDDDGNPVYQGIDQSKLVPLLVATIQELEARITALEAE